ncbi:hypothetical protein Tco_0910538 [Tanacetum coccineum]|uniref:Uncharacterized protein n=1 Tax=Tanacetum coccineum TaxID=301880 RepID=A0ABQ5CTL8_9ASTR
MIAPGPSRNSSKTASISTPKESVSSNDMVNNHYLEEAKEKSQLKKDKASHSKPSVIPSARLQNTTNGNKPKPRSSNQSTRNWPPSISSCVTNKDVHIAEQPRNQTSFFNSKHLACPTCKKCIYIANHDACILQYLYEVNSRAKAQSLKTTKRYKSVA